MKIGMVCPYSFDVPGGVQAHVVELAEVFIDRGHTVSVLAPAADETVLPDYVVSAGPAVALPYNGSVSRVCFSPHGYLTLRRWIADNEFDV
ncbi:glycosyltransferase family 4 protein, partial [Gordonia sp. 852002-10350_SCH5691597]